MSTKLDQALAAGYFALAHALPDSDRPDAGSAAPRGWATTARRNGLLDGSENRIGSANVVYPTGGVDGGGAPPAELAAVLPARLAAVLPARLAAVPPAELATVLAVRLAAVPPRRLAAVRSARLAEVTPRLTRRSGAPRWWFCWPAS